MSSLAPIVAYKTKIELAKAMRMGRKHAHKQPFVAEVYDQYGHRLGYANLLNLFQCSESN